MLTLINNKFTTNPKLPISDSLLLGHGLFETLRTYDKKPFQAKEHLKRLFASAKQIDLKIRFSAPEIQAMLEKIAQKSPHKTQRIKIVALPETLIITSKKESIDPKIYDGISCLSLLCQRPSPTLKSTSYLQPFLAHRQALKKGFQEAILIDAENKVTEGAYSNLFWYEGDTLYTRKDHVLPGITRDTICKLTTVKYKTITLAQLKKADEVFICNSIKGLVPVTKIDQTKINKGKPGAKTIALRALFASIISKNSR